MGTRVGRAFFGVALIMLTAVPTSRTPRLSFLPTFRLASVQTRPPTAPPP